MRKADYATLADILADERARLMHAWFEDEAERLRHVDTLRRVADRFSRQASVDRRTFMSSAGFEPPKLLP